MARWGLYCVSNKTLFYTTMVYLISHTSCYLATHPVIDMDRTITIKCLLCENPQPAVWWPWIGSCIAEDDVKWFCIGTIHNAQSLWTEEDQSSEPLKNGLIKQVWKVYCQISFCSALQKLTSLRPLHAQTVAWTCRNKLGMTVGFDVCNWNLLPTIELGIHISP